MTQKDQKQQKVNKNEARVRRMVYKKTKNPRLTKLVGDLIFSK